LDFTLYYRGELKSNGSPADKHEIRRRIHAQLKDLWQHLPLSNFTRLLAPPEEYGEGSLIRRKHGFNFVPLVAEYPGHVAELSIHLLWPASPGAIITSGGDLDNRVKTLLDALKIPAENNALPLGTVPESGEDPFFCLLEDDSLVTRPTVEADRLLEPVESKSEVVLTVRVRTKALKVMIATIGMT
jgi:hypothetical protein